MQLTLFGVYADRQYQISRGPDPLYGLSRNVSYHLSRRISIEILHYGAYPPAILLPLVIAHERVL